LNSSSLLFLSLQVGLFTSLQAKEQEFHLVKPDVQSVALMGEFNQWHGQAMTKAGDGTWTVTVSLSPGSCGYKFLIDGKDWISGPANLNRKVVDGVENSVIDVTEEPHSMAALRPSSHCANSDR
jgi:1,4-alpha-glucan branching enzyme